MSQRVEEKSRSVEGLSQLLCWYPIIFLVQLVMEMPSIYFIFFGWSWNQFCCRISVVFNASRHTSAYHFLYQIVMLIVQRIMIFGLVVSEKTTKIFCIIIDFFFLLFFIQNLIIILILFISSTIRAADYKRRGLLQTPTIYFPDYQTNSRRD